MSIPMVVLNLLKGYWVHHFTLLSYEIYTNKRTLQWIVMQKTKKNNTKRSLSSEKDLAKGQH